MLITVSVIEDNAGTRNSLSELLGTVSKLRCLSCYASGEEALLGIPAEKPDVALVDIKLPGISGIECVARLKERLPSLQMLILTRFEEADLIFKALRAGASGYLLKKAVPDEIFDAIVQVHAGGSPMSMQVARKVVEHFRKIQQPAAEVDKLSKREHEVLDLLAKGYLYKEIAVKLDISMSSVRTYLQRVYEKLHVQSRTEATLKLRSPSGTRFF
jgi:DNA-binding NarL/FixJ family response regulator